MALCPKRIEVDARRGVCSWTAIFPYPLADRQPYPEVGRDDLGIVWVPLIADEIVFRAGVEVSQCTAKPRLR